MNPLTDRHCESVELQELGKGKSKMDERKSHTVSLERNIVWAAITENRLI